MGRPCVLLVARRERLPAMVAALEGSFEVTTCTEWERARALATAGAFDAVLCEGPAPELLGGEVVAWSAGADGLLDAVRAAVVRHREAEVREARAELGRLAYRELVELSRRRAVREYLLALMREHGGSVTRAAAHADVERETMHRLLRRLDIDPAAFRGSS